jgi:acyl carrier protein
MPNTCGRVIQGLREIFPEAENLSFTEKSVLGDLPEWDSMAAVNLQTYLQEQFQIEIPLEFLVDETSVKEISTFLKSTVGSEMG